VETWEDEVREAVAAGEREFGRLDAHQTVQHNLIRRCQEILPDQPELSPAEQGTGILTEDDTAWKPWMEGNWKRIDPRAFGKLEKSVGCDKGEALPGADGLITLRIQLVKGGI
jgi:hypothetical protein